RIASFAGRAARAGADLMLTPELALCGYPPEDLLLREDFLEACERAVADLASRVKDIILVVGHPRPAGGKRYNSASVIRQGKVIGVYDKQLLPNYTVFDEERYFEPGGAPLVFGVSDVSFGVNICEDAWGMEGPARARARHGIEVRAGSWHAEAPR